MMTRRQQDTGFQPPDPAVQRLLERAEIEDVELIRFLYADHGGVIRGKATSRSRLAERLDSGIGHSRSMLAMNMLDQHQPVERLGPVGEVRLIPDPATYAPLPYSPGSAAMVSDLRHPDGSPWAACPRTFLKEAVAELGRAGYTAVAAFEPEFTLGRRLPAPGGAGDGDDGLDLFVPLDDSLCYAATGFDTAHDYTITLVRALESQGLQVEHCHPELGPGQQEVSIRHAPALRAADNHLFYRETVRGVALRMAMWASLAPKPLADQPGNGAHLHLSLWAGETNLMADERRRDWFVGGLLAHLPALTALTCGSVNSFRRLTPRSWASAYVCHGFDNREAAIRICSKLGAAGEANLEIKPSDSTANPYLALGAVLHAGLDGLRRRLDPGEPAAADPDTLPGRYPRLPATLDEALDALEADETLMTALGPLRAAAYLAVKRSEAAAFKGRSAAYECAQHLRVF